MTHDDVIATLNTSGNWYKATFSGGDNGGCVEVASVPGFVGVRDSKLGTAGPVLAFTDAEWTAFLRGIRAGEFAPGH